MSDKEQNVVLKDRNRINISGIVSVDSFDEFRICATTVNDSVITVEGENLTINEVNLDDGIIEALGVICAIFYDEKQKRNTSGFFRGLFNK